MKIYRVREVTKNGKTTFFPQYRVWYFFWRGIIATGYVALEEEFNTLKDANAFLYKKHLQDLKEKDRPTFVPKKKKSRKINHPFNPVFYRLKNTNKP